jgi:hypothetical protein
MADTTRNSQTHPSDAEIGRNRNRTGRFFVLGVYAVGTPLIGAAVGGLVPSLFIEGFGGLGAIIGGGLGTIGMLANLERLFIVRNPTTGMFVTINQLKSLLGYEDVNEYYGPGGPHISYPWETRLKENSISLEEAAQDFEFEVQCADGVLTVKGSFRLRPDPMLAVPFLTGVAAAAEEINGLIIAKAVEHLKRKKVKVAMRNISKLNEVLLEEFVGADPNSRTAIEQRFGLIISDVTVEQMLPSKELQRTLSALSEADAVAQGTLTLLGMTKKEATEARQRDAAGFNAQYNEARDRFLSVSGNMDGMNLSRTEFMLRLDGLPPELVEAIGKIADNPQLGAAIAAVAGGNKSSGSKPQRRRGGRNQKSQGGNTQ